MSNMDTTLFLVNICHIFFTEFSAQWVIYDITNYKSNVTEMTNLNLLRNYNNNNKNTNIALHTHVLHLIEMICMVWQIRIPTGDEFVEGSSTTTYACKNRYILWFYLPTCDSNTSTTFISLHPFMYVVSSNVNKIMQYLEFEGRIHVTFWRIHHFSEITHATWPVTMHTHITHMHMNYNMFDTTIQQQFVSSISIT